LQRFTDAAGVTVGAKNLNEILWLLTASHAVFEKWTQIRDLWLTGDLPGKDGECDGRKRSDNSITVAMFKGFEGITDEAIIISLFEKVLNKECVLVQDKTFRKLPLLSTLTRSYKVQRELKKVILKHVNEKWAGELGAETNWEDLAAEIPELDSEQELRKMESALTFEYTSSLISKSKTAGAPPPAITSAVDFFLARKYKKNLRTRVEPYRIILTPDHGQTFDPPIGVEETHANLAVVEFSARDQEDWTPHELVNFFTVVSNSTAEKELIFVIFSRPSRPMFLNLQTALLELGKKGCTTVQWGTLQSDREYWFDKGACVLQKELQPVIYFGMSKDSTTDWREVFTRNTEFPDLNLQEIDPVDWADLKKTDSKMTGEAALAFNVRQRAPNYKFVGGQSNEVVNNEAKSRNVYSQLFALFCRGKPTTVLDFFSGGICLKAALMEQIECISFSESEKVRNFLEDYATVLRGIPSVNRFFESAGVGDPRPSGFPQRGVAGEETPAEGRDGEKVYTAEEIDRMTQDPGQEVILAPGGQVGNLLSELEDVAEDRAQVSPERSDEGDAEEEDVSEEEEEGDGEAEEEEVEVDDEDSTDDDNDSAPEGETRPKKTRRDDDDDEDVVGSGSSGSPTTRDGRQTLGRTPENDSEGEGASDGGSFSDTPSESLMESTRQRWVDALLPTGHSADREVGPSQIRLFGSEMRVRSNQSHLETNAAARRQLEEGNDSWARRGVDSAGGRRGVDSAEARRGVESAKARRGVDSAEARRGVDSAKAQRGVELSETQRGARLEVSGSRGGVVVAEAPRNVDAGVPLVAGSSRPSRRWKHKKGSGLRKSHRSRPKKEEVTLVKGRREAQPPQAETSDTLEEVEREAVSESIQEDICPKPATEGAQKQQFTSALDIIGRIMGAPATEAFQELWGITQGAPKVPEVHPGGESSRGVVPGEELQLVRIDTPSGVVTKEDEEPVTGNHPRNLALEADMTIDEVSEALDLKLDVQSEGEIVCQDSLRVPTVGPTHLGVSLDVTENVVETSRVEVDSVGPAPHCPDAVGPSQALALETSVQRSEPAAEDAAVQSEVEEGMEPGDVDSAPDKAGSISSPTSSLYSRLSSSITSLLEKGKSSVDTVGASNYVKYLKHFEWSAGPEMGDKLSRKHGRKLLEDNPDFYKPMLSAVYAYHRQEHQNSKEIQDELGDVRVSEYGSFVE
jgi:hypothetical protein